MNEKLCVYLGIPIALITTLLIIYTAYRIESSINCKNPYKEVCIDYHYEYRLKPYPNIKGMPGLKVGSVKMIPQQVKVCDIYELQLKEGCNEK